MMKSIFALLLLSFLTGCFNNGSSNENDPSIVPADGKTRQGAVGNVIATELDVPWQINVIRSDEFYLSERGGNIAHITDGSIERETLQLNEQVVARTEGGMLGFLIYDQEKPMQAFVYHSYE